MTNRSIIIAGAAGCAVAATVLAGSTWLSSGSQAGPVTHRGIAAPAP